MLPRRRGIARLLHWRRTVASEPEAPQGRLIDVQAGRRWVVGVMVVFLTSCGSDRSVAPTANDRVPRQQSPRGTTYPWADLKQGWTKLDPPPLVAARATSVWTGTQLFYWGGDSGYGGTVHGDGAIYDPAADAWQNLPESPLSARSSAAGVWTGTEVIVWGGDGAKGGHLTMGLLTILGDALGECSLEPR